MTNRDDAKRSATLTKLLLNSKKKNRLDFVRAELRIRLYHRGLYLSIPRLGKAGMGRHALVLHCAERGEQIQSDFFPRNFMGKYVKMSVEQQQKELQKRNLKHVGTKKQLKNRLVSAVNKDAGDELMGRYRKALVERGLEDGGHNQEIIDRLVKAVLGLEEDVL